jgi:hypothetical protein
MNVPQEYNEKLGLHVIEASCSSYFFLLIWDCLSSWHIFMVLAKVVEQLSSIKRI